ncbi:MAG: hypothetical protein SPL64_01940 [Bacteroidaceae bacterium]|nr:hypothetical protein [Bacteroidaceae bacterium]
MANSLAKIHYLVEIKLPFKLFLDNNQELIIRHNTFSYRTRADVPITINKPYVAVIFDEIPEVHLMCFDIFRNQYSVFEVQYKISAFPISATYERILELRPANPDYPVFRVDDPNEFRVWGVVIHMIRTFEKI